MLALDIDGTLLDGSGTLRTVIRDAVRHLVACGVHVVLATGRSPWFGVSDLAEELGLRGIQLTMQGALALDVTRARRERVRGLPSAAYLDALAFAASEGIDPVVATLDGHRARRIPEGVDFLGASRRHGLFRVERDLRELLPETPMRVFLPTSPARHRLVRLRARERFLGHASVTWSDARGIELMAPAVNKGEALAWLARTYGYTLDETAAIGDAHNDIEMLRVAGRSAAMASAPPEVRAAAELVVPSSDEDGVVDALAAFFPDHVGVAGRAIGRLGGRGPRHRAGVLSVTGSVAGELPVGSAG